MPCLGGVAGILKAVDQVSQAKHGAGLSGWRSKLRDFGQGHAAALFEAYEQWQGLVVEVVAWQLIEIAGEQFGVAPAW